MRVIRISLSLWYDPNWRACFRLSWRRRRYWLAMPHARITNGHALAVQTGPLTFKLHTQGPDRLPASQQVGTGGPHG